MILITIRYMQQTSGDIPPQLTLFCSVIAAAADNSSYNIYIYGGYDGINSSRATSDDVYILSIPSFTWVKVYSGTSTHGRTGHKCVKVYPDQMFVLGGIQRNSTACLEGGIIQAFNLNTLKFQDSYSPTTWSEYEVPSLVTAQIGGKYVIAVLLRLLSYPFFFLFL
jgi:Kelch motif protein